MDNPTSETDEMVCRICYEGGDAGELLAPCDCQGSIKWVHRKCLDEWRLSSFNPLHVSQCGLCHGKFKFEEDAAGGGAQATREVWRKIVRFVGVRVLGFVAVVTLLGFFPEWILGEQVYDYVWFKSRILNHLTLGTVSTLVGAGSVAVVQVWSLSMLRMRDPFRLFGGGSGRRNRDSDVSGVLVILIVIGAGYLLYHFFRGLYQVAWTGRHVAAENLRNANRNMREEVVRRFRVVNRDEADNAISAATARKAEQAAAGNGAPLVGEELDDEDLASGEVDESLDEAELRRKIASLQEENTALSGSIDEVDRQIGLLQ